MTEQHSAGVERGDPCSHCLRHGGCLGASVRDAAPAEAENGCISVTQLQRGQTLYRAGDPVRAVYVVQSGALKSRRHSYVGREDIVAFRLPGDTVGLDAIAAPQHLSDAVALGPTRVCRIAVDELRRDLYGSKAVAEHLLDSLGGEFTQLHERLQNERRSAQARIAAFLLAQLQRRRRLFGERIDRFTLPMTRIDLGRFLGLATETVSRMFTRLQQEGLIVCEGSSVQVLDLETLAAHAGVHEAELAQAA